MRSSFLMMSSISGQALGNVVTMIELVVSSGMNRVSLATPSSRKPGPRPVPVVGPVVRVVGATLVWVGSPGAPVVVGRVVDGVVVLVVDPDPRPKMASSVAARSLALVFSAK